MINDIKKYRFLNIKRIKAVNPERHKLIAKEIFLFTKELALFKVKIGMISSREQKDHVRNICLNIAYYIIENHDIYEIFTAKRSLPIKRLSKETGFSGTTIEINGSFIIAYTLMLSNANYRYIQEYLNVGEYNKQVPNTFENKKQNYEGIVLKKYKKSALILTSDGKFVDIMANGVSIGQEIEGSIKKSFWFYGAAIAIAAIIVIATFTVVHKKYNDAKTTIVLTTTSKLKVQVNSLNKVVYVYSETEKGRALLSEANVLHKNVDDALKIIIEKAQEKNMLLDSTEPGGSVQYKKAITIYINDTPIAHDKLKKTEDYLTENKIHAYINNSGSEHKVGKDNITNESSEKQK